MIAKYTRKDSTPGELEAPVIMPQPMQHDDGFTLLGFDSWEDVNDEKLSSAVTGIQDFSLSREEIGFKK